MTKKNQQSHQDPFLARETEKYETPIPSREYILSVMAQLGHAVKRRPLLEQFNLEDPELQEALRRRLKAMVRDGQLLKTPEGYIPITELETCQGIVVMEREGEGYLRTQTGNIISLSGPSLYQIYDGDEVDVQIVQINKDGTSRGRVIHVLKAIKPLVIGRFLKTHSHFEVLPFDRKFTQTIIIPKERKGTAKDGDVVQIEILREEKEKYKFHPNSVGAVIEILGDFSTPGIEVKMAVRKFSISQDWPLAVINEIQKWNASQIPKASPQREDLRELPLVTIDGEDAKDFDDAVYCEVRNDGWRLWVAIADVSYYVKRGSALDKEAYARGNSTYFPGSVVPMLPEILSNELCSLKPNVPRLCMVCQMNINTDGEVTRSTFYRGVMHSKARLTYTEVAEILRGNELLKEKYAQVLPSLEALHQVYQALYQQRKERGAIDFDTIETRINFDQSGKINSIVPQTRNIAHKMIEESMLAANVCAAKFIQRHKQSALFRIHDRPPQDKLKALRGFLAEIGLDLPGREQPNAKDFSTLISRIQKRPDRHMIETVMLRSLSQAQYNPKNIGHFGLAYPSYLHFTSPIRRYPDLIVHRVIADILSGKQKKHDHQTMDLEKLGIHCSETERRSDEAVRDATMALKCHYMQDKVGDVFPGLVSGVASFGLFVELKDIYIEGLVHVTALGNEYFNYDPTHHRMVGDATGTVYRLGDRLEVKVMRVDIEAKKIDLELVASPKTKRSEKPDHKNISKKRKGRSRTKR